MDKTTRDFMASRAELYDKYEHQIEKLELALKRLNDSQSKVVLLWNVHLDNEFGTDMREAIKQAICQQIADIKFMQFRI
jgi:hypothetical protein